MRFRYHYMSPGQVQDELLKFLRLCREARIPVTSAVLAADGTAYVEYKVEKAPEQTVLADMHNNLKWLRVEEIPATLHDRPLERLEY